jgi:serine protease Do
VVRGWIGVSIQAVNPDVAKSFGLKETKGTLVVNVVVQGPADMAGVRKGDIITRFNGKDIRNLADLPLAVAEAPVGNTVLSKVWRDRREITLKVRVEELREEKPGGLQLIVRGPDLTGNPDRP